MNKPDYVSYWYEARVKHGGSDAIDFTFFSPENPEEEAQHFQCYHRDGDGIGAMCSVLAETSVGYQQPRDSRMKKPALIEWLKILFTSGEKGSRKPLPWKYRSPAESGVKPGGKVKIFSKEETASIVRHSRKRRVTLPSMLLACVNQTVAEVLMQEDSDCGDELVFPWMFPINMRGGVSVDNYQGNYTSAITIVLGKETGSTEVLSKMKKILKSGEHWKIWCMANIGKIIGQTGVEWLYRLSQNSVYMVGSCTYGGKWTAEFKDAEGSGKMLLTFGLGSAQYPVTPGGIIMNDQLVLTLKIHPSILPSDIDKADEIANSCMDFWQNAVKRGEL